MKKKQIHNTSFGPTFHFFGGQKISTFFQSTLLLESKKLVEHTPVRPESPPVYEGNPFPVGILRVPFGYVPRVWNGIFLDGINKKNEYFIVFLGGGVQGEGATVRIPREDWGTLGNIRED